MHRRASIQALALMIVGLRTRSVWANNITSLRLNQPADRLVVDDPRALKAAIAILERRYGWVITYEDPPPLYPGALVDVSVIPGLIAMDLPNQHLELPDPLPSHADAAVMLQAAIDADTAFFGHRRFERRSSSFGHHVVPVSTRNVAGAWIITESILDRPISMASDTVAGSVYFERFRDALERAAGVPVRLATIPNQFLATKAISLGADNQPAWEILCKALEALGVLLTWRLLCSAKLSEGYFLNIVVPG